METPVPLTVVEPPPPPPPSLTTILSEATRMIKADFLYYFGLSISIILPLLYLSSLPSLSSLFSSVTDPYTTFEFKHPTVVIEDKLCNTVKTYDDTFKLTLRLPSFYRFILSPSNLLAYSILNHTFLRRRLRPLKIITSLLRSMYSFYMSQLYQLFLAQFTPIFIYRLLLLLCKNTFFVTTANSDTLKVYDYTDTIEAYNSLLIVIIHLGFLYYQLSSLFGPVIVVEEETWGLGPFWLSWEVVDSQVRIKRSFVPLLLVLFYSCVVEFVVFWDPFWAVNHLIMTAILVHFSVSTNVLYTRYNIKLHL